MTKFFLNFKSNFNGYFKNNGRFALLALFSGILIGTSYVPFPAWAVFFCSVPLWWATIQADKQQRSLKVIFSFGWIAQFALTLIGFNWLYYTAREFGNLPVVVSGLTLFLFAAFMHIYIPCGLVLAIWLKRKFKLTTTPFIFVIALISALLERIWPSIFEWNMGYTLLWMKWPLFQWADTIGFWGLSTVLLLIQAVVLWAFFMYRNNDKLGALVCGLSLSIALGLLNYGGQLKQKKWAQFDSQAKFTLAQGNIANDEKIAAEKGAAFQPFVLNTYIDLIDQHLQKEPGTDIILWPETALPFALNKNFYTRLNQAHLIQQVNKWNSVLVTGGYSQDLREIDHIGNYKISNSVFFIGPQGEQQPPYNKSQLLVFGEYMPFGKEFPFLYKLLPFVGVYEKGPGPVEKSIQLLNSQLPMNQVVKLGPQICYESLDPAFSRGLSEAGAQILFNVTNDSWFGWWAEPYQHMIMTLARGVEVRRPLVRATNTGISSVILADGTELERSPMDQKWVHTYTVNYQQNAPESFYTLYGHWDWVLWFLILCLVIWKGRYVHHQKSRLE